GRSDVKLGENGRLVAEEEDPAARLVGTSGRQYDLVAIGAHGLGRQPSSQLGGVVARALRGIEKDMLIVRDERTLAGGRFLVCVEARPTHTAPCGWRSSWRRPSAARCTCAARSTWSTTTWCSTTSRTCCPTRP